MIQRVTRRGWALAGVSLAFVAAGLAAGQPVLLLWALAPVGLLATGWLRVRHVRGVARAAGIGARLMGPAGPSLPRADDPIAVRVQVSLAPLAPLVRGARICPVASPELAPAEAWAWLAPDGQAVVELVARRSGIWFVHGLRLLLDDPHGLFALEHYLPAPLELRVRPPRRFELALRRPSATTRTTIEEGLQGRRRRLRGPGTDIRELRDHRPGDAFRSIAWKASARLGRLVVKEFDADLTLSIYVALDVSASMRAGVPGQAAIDRAVTLAYTLAHVLAERRHRLGLVTFDRGVHAFLPPAVGSRATHAFVDELLDVHAVVHEAQTLVTDGELVARVGSYLERQKGVPVRRPGSRPRGAAEYDPDAVFAFVDEELARRARVAASRVQPPALAASPDFAALRQYARLHGIELPVRVGSAPGDKARGLTRAIERVLAGGAGPHVVLVLSDLYDVVEPRPFLRALALARARRHRLVLLVPDAAPDAEGPLDPLALRLSALADDSARAQRAALVRVLRAAGAAVVTWRVDEPLATLWQRMSLA